MPRIPDRWTASESSGLVPTIGPRSRSPSIRLQVREPNIAMVSLTQQPHSAQLGQSPELGLGVYGEESNGSQTRTFAESCDHRHRLPEARLGVKRQVGREHITHAAN